MRPELRNARVWMLASTVVVIAAIVVNLLPPDDLRAFDGANDKFMHVLGYVLLAIWFGGLYPRSRYGWIAIGLVMLGVAIELAQGAMNIGRLPEVRDALADCGGIVLGLTLAWSGLSGWALLLQNWLGKP